MEELKQIKKIYGEEMMHLCRELFSSILEQEGLLLEILTDHLAPTHSFASDVKEANMCNQFKKWIYSYVKEKENILPDTKKTPFELMKEAGYTLYECKTEEDIQSFKHYYRRDEELCTFRGGRLDRCHVFFAVKDNVDEIKREDFKNPERQDEYGTSVISIQFARGEINTISIKNRYNHTVNNPDATFSNNLENIIPGLTKSFIKHYNYNICLNNRSEADFLTEDLPYIPIRDDKYYRYNIEVDNFYFCENNVVIHNGFTCGSYDKNKERYILIDIYVVDLKEKKILFVEGVNCYRPSGDAFIASIRSIGDISKIDVTKDGENRMIKFCYTDGKEVKVGINKHNAIISYENSYIDSIQYGFMEYNKELNSIKAPNVLNIKGHCLFDNNMLTEIDFPKLRTLGSACFYRNANISKVNLPNVFLIGDNCLTGNFSLTEISLPKIETIGNKFLFQNTKIEKVYWPKVERIGNECLSYTKQIKEIDLPNVKTIGNNFLFYAALLERVNFPVVNSIGHGCLFYNEKLISIDFPELETVGNSFMYYNFILCNVKLPKLETIGSNFLEANLYLTAIDLPNVREIGDDFLYSNSVLKSINMPNLDSISELQSDYLEKLLKKKKNKKNRRKK